MIKTTIKQEIKHKQRDMELFNKLKGQYERDLKALSSNKPLAKAYLTSKIDLMHKAFKLASEKNNKLQSISDEQ